VKELFERFHRTIIFCGILFISSIISARKYMSFVVKPTIRSISVEDSAAKLVYQHAAAAIVLGVLAIRICYMLWLSPWELVGDEAYYWEWTRHLDWCYYEKGPGLAFLLAPFVKVLGNKEFAIRLPMALLSAITAWMLGRLAVSVNGGDERAGIFAVILFCVTPAFSANAQLCTQDGPIILIWTALAACGLQLIRRWEMGEPRLVDWLAMAFWLGVGFLFKQSILLFGTSVVVYVIVRRRQLKWSGRVVLQILVAGVLAMMFSLPMVLWNARHGWPTLAHTLGHLGAGGDHEVDEKSVYSPVKWFFSLLGTEVGAFGPPLLLMMVLACLAAIRMRKSDNGLWVARLWMICCAVPSIAFFTLLSLRKEVLGNWPFPSFVTLIALAGDWLARQWTLDLKKSRPNVAGLWKLTKWYGVIGCLVIAFPTWLGHLPIAKVGTQSLLARMTGHRQHAADIQHAREVARVQTGSEPMVVARYYMVAALDAFYLEDHPTVFCAGTAFGKRPTAYDFWDNTNLNQPALRGRVAVLDRLVSRTWGDVLAFDQTSEIGSDALLGTGFRGIRAKLDLNQGMIGKR